jgi:excisionase family DNA binding protein
MELSKAFYSPTEVGEMLGVTSDTVLNYIHEEKLFAIQLSERTYRIPQRELARVLGMPLTPPQVIEKPHGGEAAAKRIRERVRNEERRPVSR